MSAIYICPMTGQLMRTMPGGAAPVPAGPGERPTPGATFVCHRSGRLMRVGPSGYPEPADAGGMMPSAPAPSAPVYTSYPTTAAAVGAGGFSYGGYGGYGAPVMTQQPQMQMQQVQQQPSYGYPATTGYVSYGGGFPAAGYTQTARGW